MELSFFTDAAVEERGICFASCGDLGDAPEKHRWRASWADDWNAGVPVGITLTAYPVVSLTRSGAWVDPYAYLHGNWDLSGQKRLCFNGSGMSWAKQTKDEALRSLAYRLVRWAQKSRRDMNRVEAAIEVTKRLLPQWNGYADSAERSAT